MHALSTQQTNISDGGESKYVTFCLCFLLYFDTSLRACLYKASDFPFAKAHTHTHALTLLSGMVGGWIGVVRIRQRVEVCIAGKWMLCGMGKKNSRKTA